MPDPREDVIGRLAVERGMVSPEDMETCLRDLCDSDGEKLLGRALVERGLLNGEQLAELIRARDSRDGGDEHRVQRFGDILVARGVLARADLQRCLARQARDRAERISRPLGFYLVDENLVSVKHIEQALAGQDKEILVCSYCSAAYNVTGYQPGHRLICRKCLASLRVPETGDTRMLDVESHEVAFRDGEGGIEVRVTSPSRTALLPPGELGGGEPPAVPPASGEKDAAGAVSPESGDDLTIPDFEPPPMEEPEDDPALGIVIGGCELIEKVGEGGMGAVYRARHALLDKIVAVKLLRRDLLRDSASVQRFYNEARAAARLEHDHIVPVYNVGWEQGHHFITMQFQDGHDVATRIETQGAYLATGALPVIHAVCSALAYAHERGLVHRDIKPENVIISTDGSIKVADFGLVKNIYERDENITGEGQIVGSPHYMAPEIINEEEIDERCDLYSLGATLYHMLAGYRPFEAPSTFGILMKHLNEQPTPLIEALSDIPPEVSALTARLMAKSPDDRFPSADAVREEIERIMAGYSALAQVAQPPPPPTAAAGDAETGAGAREAHDAVIRARALLDQGNPGQALADLLEAWKLAPGSDELLNLILSAEAETSRAVQIRAYKTTISVFIDARNFGLAFDTIEEAMKVAPDDPDLLKYRRDVTALRDIHRKKELLACIDAAIKEEDHEALLEHCDELIKVDPGLRAARELRENTRKRLTEFSRLMRAGEEAMDADNPTAALENFRRAHKILPRDQGVVDEIMRANRRIEEREPPENEA